jgi:hypothetical protein
MGRDAMPILGFMGGGQRGAPPKVPTPDQNMNGAALGQDEVDQLVATQDARYDAMTEEERDKYYVHPNMLIKIKKAWRGE